MKAVPLQLGIYEHYRGKRYEVLGIAEHEATGEEMVVYRALYGEKKLWVRALNIFLEEVDVDGNKVPRFRYVGDESK